MASRGRRESDSGVHLSVGSTRNALRPDDPGRGEVLAAPAPRRRGRIAGVVALVVVGFLVGWGAGFERGHQVATDDRSNLPRVVDTGVTTPRAATGAGLQATGQRCAVQVDDQLWLGIEVANIDSVRLAVRRLRVSMPMGGLQETSLLLGACGHLGAVSAATDVGRDPRAMLNPAESTWVSGIFDVLEPCPAPFPVQFLVDYTDPDGENFAVASGSFPDLGEVEYSGC